MLDYKIVDVAEKYYLYVERKCSMDPEAVSKAMGEAFKCVAEFADEHGIAAAGPPLSVYYTYDPNELEFRSGVFVRADDLNKISGEVKIANTPAGSVLTVTHTGPYHALRDTYAEIMKDLEEQGKRPGAPTWEEYVDDPETTPETELRTQIYMPLV